MSEEKRVVGKTEVMRYEDKSIIMENFLIGTVKGFPNNKRDQLYHNHYQMTIEYENRTVGFDFYGSYSDYQKRNLLWEKCFTRSVLMIEKLYYPNRILQN